jgi:hypothetical protein
MYTRVIRTAPLCTFVLIALVGCAGDDDDKPSPKDICTPNMSSLSLGMAMSSDDPCGPQPAGSVCDPAKGHIAFATCDPTGHWIKAKDMATGMPTKSIQCDCMTCGNNVVESNYGEQCEPKLAPSTTCAALTGNPMSTGTVSCTAACTYMMMCTSPAPAAVRPSNGGAAAGG